MITFISNADTDLLALRSIVEGLDGGLDTTRAASASPNDTLGDLEEGSVVILRLLGGIKAWPTQVGELLERAERGAITLWAFSGDTTFDPEMAAISTPHIDDVAFGFEYLRHGGLENLRFLLYHVANVSLGAQLPISPPKVVPETGSFRRHPLVVGRPSVAVVFYRSHLLSGNVGFIDDLLDACEEAGVNATAVFANSLRGTSGA
ncbi:MAG: cobaltochelatase subunit CobN, partial [Acidimicrobiales bacterium]